MEVDKKFEVKVDKKSEVAIIHLSGEINTFSDEAINKIYNTIEFKGTPRLIVDFEGVSLINSAGITTLVVIVMDMVEKKGTLKFAGLAPLYHRVIEIVGITDYVELYNSVEEALGER